MVCFYTSLKVGKPVVTRCVLPESVTSWNARHWQTVQRFRCLISADLSSPLICCSDQVYAGK